MGGTDGISTNGINPGIDRVAPEIHNPKAGGIFARVLKGLKQS
jgi:hypothetical protein